MLRLWRQRPILISAFLIATCLTLFFAGRLVSQAIYWSNPAHQNQQVQGWMTIGYIAKSWKLSAPQLDALADLPGPKIKGHPQPLSEIAADRGVTVSEIIDVVEKAVTTLQLAEPQK